MADQLLLVAAGLLALGGLAALVVLAMAASTAYRVVRPRREWRPEAWRPPTAPHEAVTFTVPEGARRAGWLFPPPPGGATIILCHGFTTNRTECQDIAEALSEQGFGVLAFDFRAHGDSDGTNCSVGLHEVDDLMAAVSYLTQRYGPASREAQQLAVLGISMGAAVALQGAARCERLRAVVADSAFATLQRAIDHGGRHFVRVPLPLFTMLTVWCAERITGCRVSLVQPVEVVHRIPPRPVLLIHGAADSIISQEDSVQLAERLGAHAQLWLVPDAEHAQARVVQPEEYWQRVAAFFTRALAAPIPAAPPEQPQIAPVPAR